MSCFQNLLLFSFDYFSINWYFILEDSNETPQILQGVHGATDCYFSTTKSVDILGAANISVAASVDEGLGCYSALIYSNCNQIFSAINAYKTVRIRNTTVFALNQSLERIQTEFSSGKLCNPAKRRTPYW